VDRLYLEKGVLSRDLTIQDTVQKLGTIPLKYQPGSMWEYSVSTDVLGRLVEVLSGQPFDEYLRTRIFEPLGMTDTGFFVPAEEAHRLATVYTPNEDNTAITPFEDEKAQDFTKPTAYFSGGGGLVSTASDYYRFCQMLLDGGELDGVRILGPETIELMTEDHLDGIPMRDPGGTYGFGLGFGISPDRGASGSVVSKGSFWWGGMAHTGFWIDPEEELIGIFLTQILPESPVSYRDLFAPVVYQAVVD
jgi:CubicO group peptidase (beta-lactamase class C family)